MAEYGLLRFDNLSPGGDYGRITPCHWIATTGLGPSLHGVEVYRPEPVAFFAVHRLDLLHEAAGGSLPSSPQGSPPRTRAWYQRCEVHDQLSDG
jgi:hypothetical protein